MKYPKPYWQYRAWKRNNARDRHLIELYQSGFRWNKEKKNDYVRSLIRN